MDWLDKLYVCDYKLVPIKENSIDLTVMSPPYDNIRTYNGNSTFDISEIGKFLYAATKDGGVAAVVINDGTKDFAKSLTSFRLAVSWCDMGWKLFETIIYARDGRPGAWWKTRLRVDHEYIFVFFKGKRPKTFHKPLVPSKHAGKSFSGTNRRTDGGLNTIPTRIVNPFKDRGTVWRYATSNSERNPRKMEHPATFPDKLAEDLILCFSDEGDIVLDPMCGSGTTLVMAKKNNRRYVGSEINPQYAEIARDRLSA